MAASAGRWGRFLKGRVAKLVDAGECVTAPIPKDDKKRTT